MRKRFVIVLLVISLSLMLTIDVLAGGDKQRGDVGAGEVHQHMIMPPWWAIN